MAKKATGKGSGAKSKSEGKGTAKSQAVVRRQSSGGGKPRPDAGEMFIKLLQSPLVAELVAVAATAALAALAEHGFTTGGSGTRGSAVAFAADSNDIVRVCVGLRAAVDSQRSRIGRAPDHGHHRDRRHAGGHPDCCVHYSGSLRGCGEALAGKRRGCD